MPRPSRKTQTVSKEEAQRLYLEARGNGLSNAEAMTVAKRDLKTLEYWRKTDAEFRSRADQMTTLAKAKQDENPRDLSFPEFSERFLGQKVYWHQLQWIDLLEGRAPRDLHPSQIYTPGDPHRVLINTPPHHAKSTTLTMNYVTYRICMDQNIRVKIVSQSLPMAEDFLGTIKQHLTHEKYTALQAAYGPANGWKATATQWKQNRIMVGRQSTEKDPTVQALGIGGQIYGARSNLIILDDTITGKNAHEWQKQLRWLRREVTNRLGKTGQLIIVGTRIQAVDLYRELRNGDNFSSGASTWTYFAQPAVLRYAEDPKDWATLWPKSNAPIEEGSAEEEADEDGLYRAWDGPALAKVRSEIDSTDWALVFMQAEVDENTAFPPHAVNAAINGMRRAGPMRAGQPGHRRAGMEGLYVIGSMDPSGAGQTALLVYAVDRETKRRYVLDVKTIQPWTWQAVSGLVKTWTSEYGIDEWVVEKNMYHSGFRHNEDLIQHLQSVGVPVREHYTDAGKWDVNLGVTSLSPLFGEYAYSEVTQRWEQRVEPLIELPSRAQHPGMNALYEQLTTWVPDTKGLTDTVMALWFAEIRARAVTTGRRDGRPTHAPNRFASRRALAGRGVINLREYAQRGA